MFGFTNQPSSAPPNSQPATNHFPFNNYFGQPLDFYTQLNQQLTSNNYDPGTPNSTMNNLANSFQQNFHTNSGFPTPIMSAATTPIQPENPFFNHQSQSHSQPTTSMQSSGDFVSSLNSLNCLSHQQPSTSASSPFQNLFSGHNLGTLQHQQNWPQAWPSNSFQTQQSPSFYNPPPSFGYTPTTPGLNGTLEQTLQQYMIPDPAISNEKPMSVSNLPKNALERTIVLIQKQNPYTLTWSEKTTELYFKKWFDATLNVSLGNIESVKIMSVPTLIIGFYAFDLDTAKYLVNVFADGQLRNDVLLKSAPAFMIQLMKHNGSQNGNLNQIQNIDDAFSALSDIKKQTQQPMSAPPYTSYSPFITNT